VAFILYPYTTFLKANALSPDDYILGFGPLTNILNDPRGVLNGPSIVRTIKADAAFGSILFVPMLIMLLAKLLLEILKRQATWHRVAIVSEQNDSNLINLFGSQAAITVFLSSLTCFLFFSWSLYSQSFLSKYLGSTFVPFIPVLGVGLALLYRPKMRVHSIALVLCVIYAMLRFGFLVNIDLAPNFVKNLINNPDYLNATQTSNLMYNQYVSSAYSPEQSNRWLSSLAKLSANQTHVLCFGSNTATLTPLMYVVQSLNSSRRPEFRLSDPSHCMVELKDPAIDNKKTNFIFFF
jgi:hypothetical protein